MSVLSLAGAAPFGNESIRIVYEPNIYPEPTGCCGRLFRFRPNKEKIVFLLKEHLKDKITENWQSIPIENCYYNNGKYYYGNKYVHYKQINIKTMMDCINKALLDVKDYTLKVTSPFNYVITNLKFKE